MLCRLINVYSFARAYDISIVCLVQALGVHSPYKHSCFAEILLILMKRDIVLNILSDDKSAIV